MKQLVLPIKDSNVMHEVEDTLLNNFRFGRRNYTIFQVGKATLLRVSDVLALKKDAVFDSNGTTKKNAYIKDKKTGKPNVLYLKPVTDVLTKYYQWLQKNNMDSVWLFPSMKHFDRHITRNNSIKSWLKPVTY